MPTLPSFEQLGQVQAQPAQGPLVSPDVVAETAKAGEELGKSITSVGSDLNRADYYEGNMQRGYAEANLKTGAVALQQEIMSDPTNYATATDRFNKGYNDLLAQQRGTIGNPVMQAKFMAQAGMSQAIFQKQIDTFARSASNQDQVSKYDLQKQSLIQGAVLNPNMAASNLQTLRDLNQSLVEHGARDAAHATMENQNVAQQFAIARLKFMPPAQQVAALQPLMDQARGNAAPASDNTAPANTNLPTTSDTAIPYVMNRFEGAQLVQNDNGHGPSRYGIVAADNGLTPQQVANLSPDKAAQLYKTNYWDRISADSLPANMRLAAFDTAVQFGPDTAQKMIDQADGNPQKLLDLRAQAYGNLVTQNPARYAGSAQGWASRQQLLGQALTGQDKKNITDWTQMLPPEKLPELYSQAQAELEKSQREEVRANTAQYQDTQQKFVSAWAQDKLQTSDILQSNLPALGDGGKQWWIDKVSKGPDKVDPNSPDVIRQRGILENMKVDNPQQFMNTDFTSLAGKIPGSEIARFQGDAAQIRKAAQDGGVTQDNKTAKAVVDSVSDMLPLAWKNPKNDSAAQDASAFKGNLIEAARDASAAGGKPLSRDDVRKMASDMLGAAVSGGQDVSIKGGGAIWGDKTVHPYQVPPGTNPASVYRGTPDQVYVPESFRIGFARAWQNKYGTAPAENDVRLGYTKSLQPPAQ